MLHFTRKQACAVAVSAVFALAVFSAPVVPAVFALGDPLPSVSETPVSEDPFPPFESADPGVSEQPVIPGEPDGNVSGGITPTPEDPSSAGSDSSQASGSESGSSSGDVSSGDPSSEAVSSEAPSSEPETPSYQEPDTPVYSSPVTNPDTNQGLIDQIASQAAQANSDPEALSSQDWSILLSQADGGDGAASESSGSDASAGGALLPDDGDDGNSGGAVVSTRSSWLLPVGIVLILLAAAGIGLFVYLQFIAPRRKASVPPAGGRIDPSNDDSFASSGEDEYVDVSSVTSHHTYPVDDDPYEEYARAREARESAVEQDASVATQETIELSSVTPDEPETPPAEMEDLFSSDETERLVRSGGTRQTQLPIDPQPAAKPEPPAQPQATEEPQGDKPFDWDRFFKE